VLFVVIGLVEVGVVLEGFLFGNLAVPGVVHALVNDQVHLFEQKAVCWDTISLLEVDDIANNYIFNKNGDASSIGASLDGNLLVVDLVLQLKELLFFFPVTSRRNSGSKKDTAEDGERFDIFLGGLISKQGEHEVSHGCPNQKDHVVVFELSAKQVLIGLNRGRCYIVFTKDFSPSIKVMYVTNDSTLRICVKKSAQSSIVSTLF
jgi:hypothetical protein